MRKDGEVTGHRISRHAQPRCQIAGRCFSPLSKDGHASKARWLRESAQQGHRVRQFHITRIIGKTGRSTGCGGFAEEALNQQNHYDISGIVEMTGIIFLYELQEPLSRLPDLESTTRLKGIDLCTRIPLSKSFTNSAARR